MCPGCTSTACGPRCRKTTDPVDLVIANDSGTYDIRLDEVHRDLLRMLASDMRDVVLERDPTAWRLFPNPYEDDPLQALQYEEMMSDDLREKRLAALQMLEDTADATELNEEEVQQWMTSVNDIRLVLGTRLDVTEESDFEDWPEESREQMMFSVYGLLGYILEEIVVAVMSR